MKWKIIQTNSMKLSAGLKIYRSFFNDFNSKQFATNHSVGFCIFIFSISLILFYLTRFSLRPDDINYVRYASYIVNSQGQIPENTLDDLSKIYNAPIVGYPWGSALIIAFFNLLGFDILVSFAIVKSFTVAIFYIVTLGILNYMDVPGRIQFYFSILCLPLLNLFYFHYISDSLSLLFYSLGILMTLRLIKKQKSGILNILLFSLVLFLPAFFRYAYYPLTFIIPFVILWIGFKESNKKNIKTGALLLIFVTLLISANMLFENMKTGRMLFLNQNYGYTHNNLYIENLLLFDGFALKAFFNYSKVIGVLGVNFLSPLFLLTSFLILIAIVLYGSKRLKYESDNFKVFYTIQVLFLIFNTLLLIVLSLKEAPQPIDGFWTYVKETRYYSVSMVFVLIICFMALADQRINYIYKKTIYLLLICSFFYSLAMLGKGALSSFTNPAQLTRQEVYQATKEIVNNNPDSHIIFSSEQNSINNLISSTGAIRLVSQPNNISLESNLYDSLLRKDMLYAGKPVKLLVHLMENENAESFKNKYNPTELLKIPGSGLYILDIDGYVYPTNTTK